MTSSIGTVLYSCRGEEGQTLARCLEQVLPRGSFLRVDGGIRLVRMLPALGFESEDDFAELCERWASLAGAGPRKVANEIERSVRRLARHPERDAVMPTGPGEGQTKPASGRSVPAKPSSFTVWGKGGEVLYRCTKETKARRVRSYLVRELPAGYYRMSEDGMTLTRGLDRLGRGLGSAGKFAQRCAAAARTRDFDSIGRQAPPARSGSGPAAPTARNGDPVAFDGPEHVLYVRKGTASCRARGHRVGPATGTLSALDGRELRMNVNYCEDCGVYFVGTSEWRHYRERFGPVLGNFSFDEGWGRPGAGVGSLADESPLMLCGYSVSEAEGLTPKQRHLVLANFMDRGILDKPRVIEYLQFFAARARNRPNMGLAVAKWEADLEWVRAYRIDSQRRFTVSEVRRFR